MWGIPSLDALVSVWLQLYYLLEFVFLKYIFCLWKNKKTKSFLLWDVGLLCFISFLIALVAFSINNVSPLDKIFIPKSMRSLCIVQNHRWVFISNVCFPGEEIFIFFSSGRSHEWQPLHCRHQKEVGVHIYDFHNIISFFCVFTYLNYHQAISLLTFPLFSF